MQTRLESVMESVTGTLSRMVCNFAIGLVIYPWFGFNASPLAVWQIVLIFTAASFIQSYIWRRWFNQLLIRRLNRGNN